MEKDWKPSEKESRRVKTRVVLAVVIGVCVSLGLFAAGQGESTPVTVKFWTHVHEHDTIQAFVDEFNTANPNIKVVYEDTPSDEYFDKVVLALSKKTGPDVFWCFDLYFPTLIQAKLIEPTKLKAFGAKNLKEYEDLFMEGVLDAYKGSEGVMYAGGISEINVWSLIYNKDHFAQAGLPLPSETDPMTWEQLTEVAQRLTKRDAAGNVTRVGYHTLSNIGAAAYWLEWFEPLLRGCGGWYWDEKGNVTINDEKGVRAMDLWRDMVVKYKVDDPKTAVMFVADLPQGRASTMLMGPWYIPVAKGINPDLNFGVAPQPVVQGGPRVTHKYSYTYLVSKDSKVKDAAWTFAAWMAMKNPEKWWSKLGFFHPTKEFMARFPYQEYPYMKTFFDDMAHGEYVVRTPKISELATIVKDAVERCTLKGMSSRESLDLAASEIKKMLAE
jgi:multiple sugar transport system substrate-binding protein